jgi:hypothetical protein
LASINSQASGKYSGGKTLYIAASMQDLASRKLIMLQLKYNQIRERITIADDFHTEFQR